MKLSSTEPHREAVKGTEVQAPKSKSKAAFLLFCITALLAAGAVAGHAQSALDGFNPNANGTIYAVVVQPDGKILLGGDFTSLSPNGGALVTRKHIARLNPDGTLDAAFDPNADGSVRSIALQADGKVLAAGNFGSIGGQTRNRIARLDAGTGASDSFDLHSNNLVLSIAVQADGKILVGGYFNGAGSIGGQTRNYIARVDPATGLADSFNPNANDGVSSIVVQTDGRILVGGLFTGIGGQTRNRIGRLDPVTGLADSFNPNANDEVYAITVEADGKILAGGAFSGANSIGGQTRNRIARLDAATGMADSFDPNASGPVVSIVIQPDGKILACGPFASIGGLSSIGIARLQAATGAVDSFDAQATSTVYAIALQADGKIVAGGFFTGMGGQPRNRIARLETDGRLDRTLNLGTLGTTAFVLATAIQPDGKVLIGGRFTNVLGVVRKNIARLNTDGTLDTGFDPNANGDVSAIAVQTDGKILVGGGFFGAASIGGQTRNYIARLDGTTGLADSFDPNASAYVNSIVIQADGKILVVGNFTGANSIGGQTRNQLARVDPTTGAADTFDANLTNRYVLAIAVQADGKILVGGDFNGPNSIGGQARNRIARLDPTTGVADSFDPNANLPVRSIVVQPDGKILVGGVFASIGGQSRNRIARLDATTGLADSFNPNSNDYIDSIGVQADGKILVSGAFNGANSIGGQARNRIARLDATTGLADSFDPNASAVAVNSLTIQADGKILAGGFFGGGTGGVGGQTLQAFARLSNDTAGLQNLAVTQTAINWTRGGSSPQFTRVTFEYSTDNLNYTLLGAGIAAGSSWTLAGLTLPALQNIYIRARGYCSSGYLNGSQSIIQSVRNVFVSPQAAQALNLSTRLRVLTGDNVGIGGFIITGTDPKHVLLRAIGPSLTAFGISNPLADPVLELHGPDSFVTVTNNNWRDTQEAAIQASGLAPTNNF